MSPRSNIFISKNKSRFDLISCSHFRSKNHPRSLPKPLRKSPKTMIYQVNGCIPFLPDFRSDFYNILRLISEQICFQNRGKIAKSPANPLQGRCEFPEISLKLRSNFFEISVQAPPGHPQNSSKNVPKTYWTPGGAPRRPKARITTNKHTVLGTRF